MRRWPDMRLTASAGSGALLVTALVAGCGVESDLAEVRLFPCLIDGMEPQSVRVEIEAFDDSGLSLGGPATGVYAVEQTVFADGYATLGWRPRPGSVTVDVSVWWYVDDTAGPLDTADAIATYAGLRAPAAGATLELGDDTCALGPGDTDPTTDGSTGTATTAGTSDTTDATTMPTTTVTSDGTTNSTSDTTGTDDTTDTTTGDTSTGTTGDPGMEGMFCAGVGEYYCEPRAIGGGKLLLCDGVWEESTVFCSAICTGAFPNPIGCAGEADEWTCLCQADVPADCDEDDNMCDFDDNLILCVGGEEARAACPNVCMYSSPDSYSCS